MQRARDVLRDQRLAKHARQIEVHVVSSDMPFAAVLGHLHSATEAAGAGRAQHRLEGQILDARLQRIFRRAGGIVALECERDLAERARCVQRAQSCKPLALW